MIPPSCLLAAQFNISDGFLIFGIFICLAFSAFFSASEMAFSTVNPLRLRNYAEEKVKGARRALYISENYDKTLSTILVGNNIANIASTTICAYLFTKFILNPTVANLLNTVVMTIIILIFGEILPKSIAKLQPEKVALKFSGFMYVLMKVLYPITIIFIGIQKLALRRAKTTDNPTVTEHELESIIDTMEEEGVIASEDADLIQNVLDLGDKVVYDIMTPRVDMVALDENSTIDEAKQVFLDTQFSRIPVYREDKDNIIGILNQKDFVLPLIKGEKVSIKNTMTAPLFVAETMKVDDLMRQMQKDKKHMAIVLDEHGGTSGLVSMEDALETMVGEIYDEHDDETITAPLVELDENHYKVDAEMDLEELFEELGIEHLPETEYATVGGMLYEKCENIPRVGEKVEIKAIDDILDEHNNYIQKVADMTFTITKVDEHRIIEADLVIVRSDIPEEN